MNERLYGDGAIHGWFELTYAQYLTVPRSVLQSMPFDWQDKFVALLGELDSTIDWRPKKGTYWVQLRGHNGRWLSLEQNDPLMDYERGGRRVALLTTSTTPSYNSSNR